jgi:photosystem II stability/assembly factor-like uncharacterized protein
MWIGGVSGGVWKTTNGGGQWFPLADFMANLAVTSLVMDPNNSNILYAATGEGTLNVDALPGGGIFKSTNGGNTWTQLPQTNPTVDPAFLFVTRLAHHPTQSNTILAAASYAVYKTTDGGATWGAGSPPTPVLTPFGRPLDVKYHPTNPLRVMVGTSSNLYYSTDGGQSDWRRETDGMPGKITDFPGRCEVAFAASNEYMYASVDDNYGEVWRSTSTSSDGGRVWTLMNNTRLYLEIQGFYDNAIWVSPTDPNFVVVGGIDLFRSTNGGTTLNYISNGFPPSPHPDQHAIVHHPAFGTSNNVVFFGNDGGIYMATNILTVDQDQGWTNLVNNLGITQFYGGAAAVDGSRILGGTQDNDIPYRLQSDPVPTNWHPREDFCCDGGFAAIDPTNPMRVYSETQNLDFIRSDNGGMSYTSKINGLLDANSPNTLFIAPFSMDPNNSNIVVAGGKSVWRTTNGADDWVPIRPPPGLGIAMCSAIDIAPGNSNIIWVGYSFGRVSRGFSSDNGTTWQWTDVNQNEPNLPTTYVTDIAINPSNNQQVFVTFGGYETSRVWMTTDNGATWIDRSGTGINTLPALQVNTVRFHPFNVNWIYIGTDLGVFASNDQGVTWNVTPRYPQPLPGLSNEGPANVAVAELFWQGADHLVAATYGRGMYRTRIFSTVYVDIANPQPGNGTLANPFNTIQQAIAAAGPDATISIKAGTYPETVTFSRRGLVQARDGTVVIAPSSSLRPVPKSPTSERKEEVR